MDILSNTVWGDVATWVTGITSIALFIVAFWQIRIERKARKHAQDERLLDERRYQAERIAGWIAGESHDEHGTVLWIAIRNQSLQPIYHLVIHGLVLSNTGTPIIDPRSDHQTRIAVVPPGFGYASLRLDYAGMFKRPGIEIAFQDVANRYWLRKTNGVLEELETSPVEYYKIDLPTGWDILVDEIPFMDMNQPQ